MLADLVELVLGATSQPEVKAFCENLQGALTFYCGGSSLVIKEQLPDVASRFNESMGNCPFLTMFTFGEQGLDNNNDNCHGNLMYSLLLFGAPKW